MTGDRKIGLLGNQANLEADVHNNIDDIIANFQKASAASLREAFEAGKAHTALELKARIAAFFEGLVSSNGGTTHTEPPPAPPSNEAAAGHNSPALL